MGGAACCELASRGARVLGLEQFPLVHEQGSSHGRTRICRRAYFEHPDYVPLVSAAYRGWDALSEATGRRLFDRVGLVLAGPPDGEIVPGVRRATAMHRLNIHDIPRDEAAERMPAFRFPPDAEIVFEPDAGLLWVESCIEAFHAVARERGAELRDRTPVRAWQSDAHGVTVRTDDGEHRAASLIVAAGAWSGRLLATLGLPLTVRRKVQLWFACDDPRYAPERGCPVFGVETGGRFFYGFPQVDAGVLKAAEHTGDESGVDADTVDRALREADVARVGQFVRACLPGVEPRVVRHSVCLYTMTPDAHFVVDRHPEFGNVWIACGFSGHGFKFAPEIGRILADGALGGDGSPSPSLLSAHRFSRANSS